MYMSDIRARWPTHRRLWRFMMLSRISIFARTTSLFLIQSCRVFCRIWRIIWCCISRFRIYLLYSIEASQAYRRFRLQQLGWPWASSFRAGLPKSLLNSFPYAEWAALLRLLTYLCYQVMEIVHHSRDPVRWWGFWLQVVVDAPDVSEAVTRTLLHWWWVRSWCTLWRSCPMNTWSLVKVHLPLASWVQVRRWHMRKMLQLVLYRLLSCNSRLVDEMHSRSKDVQVF